MSPLALRLLLLSLAAGCVDAVAFVHGGAFPANMTGNSVLLALAMARGDLAAMLPCGVALLGYLVGAATGARLVQAPGHEWTRRVDLSLLLAGALLVTVTALIAATGRSYLPGLLVLTAVAMGLQSAAVQHLAIAGVSTVFVTGTLTTAITRLVSAPRGPSPDAPAWLPAASWGSYFLGALLGGLQPLALLPLRLALPGALLVLVAALGWRRSPSSSA